MKTCATVREPTLGASALLSRQATSSTLGRSAAESIAETGAESGWEVVVLTTANLAVTVLRFVADDLPMVPLYRRTLTWAMARKVKTVQWPADLLELRWARVS